MLVHPARGPWLGAALLTAASALLVGACIHDWEEWLPPSDGTTTGSTTASGTGSGTPTGTPTGTGAFGGTDVPGSCPGSGLGSATLVKVPTPQQTGVCVDETEVTKGQYLAWLNTSPAPGTQSDPCTWNTSFTPSDADWGTAPDPADWNLPVEGVNWCDARAYCTGVGKRLCGRIVPLGDPVPTSSYADYFESEWYNACTERGAHSFPYGSSYGSATCNGTDSGETDTVDVTSLSGCVTAAGVHDLSGNVWEWENSCSGSGSETDQCRVRGGAYNAAEALLGCSADLLQPRNSTLPPLGFRCCADIEL